MAQNNNNQDYTNNADGYTLGGGTTERKLIVTGADITLTGSGTNVYTFPSATSTLYGTATGSITSSQLATSLSDETGSGVAVFATSPALVTPALGAATGTSLVLTNTSATGLAVGANGVTNPTLAVDSSTATSATGLLVKSAAATGGLALSVTSSGAAENLTINAKGTGTIGIGSVSTGAVTITPSTTITGALTLSSTLNKVTITAPATSATLTLITGSSLITAGAFALTLTSTAATNSTLPAGTHTLAGLDVAQTWSAAQSFNSSDLVLKGSVSGTTTLNSGATAATSVLTLPVATDTLVGQSTTDTLANKTLTTPTIASILASSGVKLQLNVQTDNSNVIANSAQVGTIVYTGYGQIIGGGLGNLKDTVTFPTAFTTIQGAMVTLNGYGTTAVGTSIRAAVGDWGAKSASATAHDITTSNMIVELGLSTGTFTTSTYFYYSWIAWGV